MKLFGWFKKDKAPTREPQTHDYGPGRRFWGHDYAFKPLATDKNKGTAMGWGCGLRKGDFILLDDQRGGRARYLIEEIEYVGNPGDMWSAKLTFSPRMMTAGERHEENLHGAATAMSKKSEFIS